MRRRFVSAIIASVCLSASFVHADAAQDLMNALGLSTATSFETVVPTDTTSTSVDTSLFATTTIDIPTLPDPEVEKQKQIAALKELVKTLTAKLKALIAAQKRAVASLSDTQEVCAIKRDLGLGMRGDDVKALQTFLISEGELEQGSASGRFGELTEVGVQQWQMHNGIVSYGSADTTGYGFVGKETRTLIQRGCATSAKGGYIDPAHRKNSNILASTTNPMPVRVVLSVDNVSYVRGMKIPVRITVQDPIPYLGAWIDFMQTTARGSNLFESPVYLPVGFTGQVTHSINASHMEVQANDKSFGTSDIPLSAVVQARFRDPNELAATARDAVRTIGTSDPVHVFISEDVVTGNLSYTVNGVDGDKSGDIKADFAKFFFATTTNRAAGIEYCDLLSQVVTKGSVISCKWNDEELSGMIKSKSKTIPASATGRTKGLYSLFMTGAISDTQFSISRQDALTSCGRTHTENPTASITCVWDNEIIYDNGGLEDPPVDTYVEPGAAPIII